MRCRIEITAKPDGSGFAVVFVAVGESRVMRGAIFHSRMAGWETYTFANGSFDVHRG
jgi:hypothetical protein